MTELSRSVPVDGTVLTPAGDTEPGVAKRRSLVPPASVALALASPAVTATMLMLARRWSEHGARHSIGDMVPLGLLTIIGLAVTAWASATEDALLVGTCATLTAAAIGVGMMAYPTGLAEPLIVTAAGTVLGWVLTRRQWRQHSIRRETAAERQADRIHQHSVVGMQAQTAIEITALREQGATDREKLRQLGATKRLELQLDAAEFEALKLERDVQRRHFLAVSDTARAALQTTPVAVLEPPDELEAVASAVFGDLTTTAGT